MAGRTSYKQYESCSKVAWSVHIGVTSDGTLVMKCSSLHWPHVFNQMSERAVMPRAPISNLLRSARHSICSHVKGRNYMPVGFDGREPPAQILCQSSLLQFAVAVISIDVAKIKTRGPYSGERVGSLFICLNVTCRVARLHVRSLLCRVHGRE